MLRLIFAAKTGPTRGIEPDNWALKFPALWQPTAKEQAETRKIVAETDAINYDMGLVTSEELRNARFGGEEYSAETEIDDTLDPAQTAVLAGQAEKDPANATALAPTP